jgi:probable rRNA maturation factor
MADAPRVLCSRRGRLGRYAAELERAAVAMLRAAGRRAGLDRRHELSLVLCDNATIRRINRRWRGMDRPTDVLSFPLHAPRPGRRPPEGPLGDIVISLPTARLAARQESRPVKGRLEWLAVHGLAHLLGHDHQRTAEALRMEREERRLLGREER